MTATEFLKEHRVYEDEIIYNSVGEIVGTVSQLMDEYAALRQQLVSISFSSESDHNCMMYLDKQRTCMVCGKQNCC